MDARRRRRCGGDGVCPRPASIRRRARAVRAGWWWAQADSFAPPSSHPCRRSDLSRGVGGSQSGSDAGMSSSAADGGVTGSGSAGGIGSSEAGACDSVSGPFSATGAVPGAASWSSCSVSNSGSAGAGFVDVRLAPSPAGGVSIWFGGRRLRSEFTCNQPAKPLGPFDDYSPCGSSPNEKIPGLGALGFT